MRKKQDKFKGELLHIPKSLFFTKKSVLAAEHMQQKGAAAVSLKAVLSSVEAGIPLKYLNESKKRWEGVILQCVCLCVCTRLGLPVCLSVGRALGDIP